MIRIQTYFVTFYKFHKSMYIRLLNTAEVLRRACKVSQGASTLFKVC